MSTKVKMTSILKKEKKKEKCIGKLMYKGKWKYT